MTTKSVQSRILSDVVKIQRPLAGNEGDVVLIYNRDQSIFVQISMWADLRKLMGADMKAFVECALIPSGPESYNIELGRKLALHEWPEW